MEEIRTTSAAWKRVRFNKNQRIAQQSCALHDNKYRYTLLSNCCVSHRKLRKLSEIACLIKTCICLYRGSETQSRCNSAVVLTAEDQWVAGSVEYRSYRPFLGSLSFLLAV